MDNKILSILGLSLAFGGCSQPEQAVALAQVESTGELSFSREQLQQQLEKLAESPAPEKLRMGAMCYDTCIPLAEAYNCPVCLSKTVIADNSSYLKFIVAELSSLHKQARELRELGLDIHLDESRMCSNCSPDSTRELCWRIKVEDKEIVSKFEYFDYEIMKAFLHNKRVVADIQENETPLKNYLPRLRQLLGMAAKEENKK